MGGRKGPKVSRIPQDPKRGHFGGFGGSRDAAFLCGGAALMAVRELSRSTGHSKEQYVHNPRTFSNSKVLIGPGIRTPLRSRSEFEHRKIVLSLEGLAGRISLFGCARQWLANRSVRQADNIGNPNIHVWCFYPSYRGHAPRSSLKDLDAPRASLGLSEIAANSD